MFICNINSFQGEYFEKKIKFCEIHFEINQKLQFLIIGPQTDNNGTAVLLNFDNEWTPTTYSTVLTCARGNKLKIYSFINSIHFINEYNTPKNIFFDTSHEIFLNFEHWHPSLYPHFIY